MAYSYRGHQCRMDRKPRHGNRSRKLGVHILSALRKQRESRKWEGAGYKTSKPAAAGFSLIRFRLLKVQYTPPNSVTSRGQNIKYVNLQGNICLSNNRSLCERHILKTEQHGGNLGGYSQITVQVETPPTADYCLRDVDGDWKQQMSPQISVPLTPMSPKRVFHVNHLIWSLNRTDSKCLTARYLDNPAIYFFMYVLTVLSVKSSCGRWLWLWKHAAHTTCTRREGPALFR